MYGVFGWTDEEPLRLTIELSTSLLIQAGSSLLYARADIGMTNWGTSEAGIGPAKDTRSVLK